MSNEISLFREAAAVIPAHLRTGALDDLTKSLMGGGGVINKRISIKGNVFRMIVDGQEVMKNEDRSMDIVVINAAPKTSRTFYADTFKEGEVTLPSCWSNDGVKPDPTSEKVQASACALCPQNIAGSGQGTSRACRFSRRLAVVIGQPTEDSDIYQLVLPAQSIFGKADNGKMPLEAYAKFLGGNGLSITSVVTEMRFDTSSATPKLTFRAVKPLTVEEIEIAVEKGQSPIAIQAVSYNPGAIDGQAKKEKELPFEQPATPIFREPVAEAAPAPTVREKKSAPVVKDLADVLNQWGDDED